MSLLQIMKRELHRIFRLDPRCVLFTLFAALLYLFLFGALYRPGIVKHVPAVLCDESQTHLSRELVRAFTDSESFHIMGEVSSEEEMRHILAEKNACMAIEIPSDFTEQIARGQSATILYMVNGANILFTSVTSTAVQDIVSEFSNQIAAQNAALRMGNDEAVLMEKIVPLHANFRVLGNPTQTYLFFFSIGLAMTAFHQGMLFAMAASVHHDFCHPSKISGTPIRKLLFGKFLLHWILALASFAAFLFSAVYGLDIPAKAAFWKFLLLGAVFSSTMLLLGLLFSFIARTELQFAKLSLLYVVPAFIFSGYTWPLEGMPQGMQLLAKLLFPLTWMLNTMRDLMLSGTSGTFWHSILALSAMGLSCLPFLEHAASRACHR